MKIMVEEGVKITIEESPMTISRRGMPRGVEMTQHEYDVEDMEDHPMSQDEYDQRLYDEIANTPGATFEILHEKMLGLAGPHSYSAEAQLWDSLWRMDVRHQIAAYWEYPVGTTAETLGNKPRTRHYQIYEGGRPGGDQK